VNVREKHPIEDRVAERVFVRVFVREGSEFLFPFPFPEEVYGK